jgi:hypothetical protein
VTAARPPSDRAGCGSGIGGGPGSGSGSGTGGCGGIGSGRDARVGVVIVDLSVGPADVASFPPLAGGNPRRVT